MFTFALNPSVLLSQGSTNSNALPSTTFSSFRDSLRVTKECQQIVRDALATAASLFPRKSQRWQMCVLNGWHLWAVVLHVMSSLMLPKAAEIQWYGKPGKRASSLLCEILGSSLHAMEQYLACMFTEALATDREHFLTTFKKCFRAPLYGECKISTGI